MTSLDRARWASLDLRASDGAIARSRMVDREWLTQISRRAAPVVRGSLEPRTTGFASTAANDMDEECANDTIESNTGWQRASYQMEYLAQLGNTALLPAQSELYGIAFHVAHAA